MSDSAATQNFKAGLFVLTGLVLAIAMVFILSNAWSSMFGVRHVDYTVKFPVSQGVKFLSSGSDVRLGGLKVGRVQSVVLDHEKDPVEHVRVIFSMPAHIGLFSNAVVFVNTALIGNQSFLEIDSVGWDDADRPSGAVGKPGVKLAAGDLLLGTPGEGMITSMLGPAGASDATAMLANMSAISKKLRSDGALLPWAMGDKPAGDFTGGVAALGRTMQRIEGDGQLLPWALGDDSAADVEASLKAVRSTLTSLEGHWPVWSSAVGSTLANLDLSSQQMTMMMQELRNSPWRLLYRPTEVESSNELLFEASRNFVFGAADLRSAAQSMQAFIDRRGEAAADTQAFKLMQKNLLESARRYERAQQELEQVLQHVGPHSTP
ncbi:MAG: MlaD family protein [Phycisphaerales bacterium]|nr:MlaD family protein [Phycisphaerales bacterium]